MKAAYLAEAAAAIVAEDLLQKEARWEDSFVEAVARIA